MICVFICVASILLLARYLWRRWVHWGEVALGFVDRTSYVPSLQPLPVARDPEESRPELVAFITESISKKSSVAAQPRPIEETNGYIPLASVKLD